ncbi:MAG: heparinase II/III domain-containing protein, partial [Spirochaetota bacterium]
MEQTHVALRVGAPIDWNARPNGDREWNHSLRRMFHLIDLAAAYRITREDLFLATWVDHVGSFTAWIDRNGRDRDNLLNCAIRTRNIVASLDVIGAGVQSDAPVRVGREVTRGDVAHLARHLGEKVGNWEFFISTSILIAARYFDFVHDREAASAERRLASILETEINEDGVLLEAVPRYHGQVVLALLEYVMSCTSNGLEPGAEVAGALPRLIRALMGVTDPEGLVFPIGDSDRMDPGYILAFARSIPGLRLGNDITSRPPATTYFPATGWSVVRPAAGESEPMAVLLDHSPKPAAPRNWHSHADELQVLVHTASGPLLADPGRFTYGSCVWTIPVVGRPVAAGSRLDRFFGRLRPRDGRARGQSWREYYRSTRVHSTAMIDGAELPGYGAPHAASSAIDSSPPVEMGELTVVWARRRWGDSDDASADRLPQHSHTRSVVVGSNVVLVWDEFECGAEVSWRHTFQFGEGVSASRESDTAIALQRSGRRTSTMGIFSGTPGFSSVFVERSEVSPAYNLRTAADSVRTVSKSATRATVLAALYVGESPAVWSLDGELGDESTVALRLRDSSTGEHRIGLRLERNSSRGADEPLRIQ